MPERFRGVIRPTAFLAVAVATSAIFLGVVTGTYPVRDWLLWTVLQLWGWQGLLAAAQIAIGNLILDRVLRIREPPRLARLTLAAALGAMTFALGMFAAGVAGVLRPPWAVVWPAALLLGGAWGAPSSLRELVLPGRRYPERPSILVGATLGFGMLGLVMVYLGLFAPDAVSFDGAWTHLVIAQDYAREGRIVPFEADWPKNLAHLGSVINTWAFLLPGLEPTPVRWMMGLHTEFTFFLFTLVGVAAGVEWAVGRRVRGAWAILFMFPGLFVYDGNLGAAGDHFAAFFVAPAFLAAVHGAGTLDRRWWALFGLLAGGALITKYQTFYFLVPLSALLAVGWVRSVVQVALRSRGRFRRTLEITPAPRHVPSFREWWAGAARLMAPPLLAMALLAAIASTHFLRNWVFYGDPLYPFAQRLFPGCHPRLADSAVMAENIILHFGTKPPAELGQRLSETIRLLVGFSFTNRIPIFGSLFTLSLPLLVFFPRARRLWLTSVLGLMSVFAWGWTYRVERNLQTFVPLLSIAVGAILARTWEGGRAARLSVALLLGVQLIWSGDHFFLGGNRVNDATNLIRSGFDGRAATRFDGYAGFRVALGRWLPPDAKVLLHNLHENLGINRPLWHDGLGFQALIDPRTFATPRALYDRFRAVGITHVVWQPGYYPAPSKQEEVVFAAFAHRYRASQKDFSPLAVLPMPASPPVDEPPYAVLTVGIGGYPDGVYEVSQLGAVEIMPYELQRHGTPRSTTTLADAPTHFAEVNAVLLGDAARELRSQAGLTGSFDLATEYPGFSVWVRR